MDNQKLKKFHQIDSILHDNLFQISEKISPWKYAYTEKTFDGKIEYDSENDWLKIINGDNDTLIVLEGNDLNEYTVFQYLIQYVGK